MAGVMVAVSAADGKAQGAIWLTTNGRVVKLFGLLTLSIVPVNVHVICCELVKGLLPFAASTALAGQDQPPVFTVAVASPGGNRISTATVGSVVLPCPMFVRVTLYCPAWLIINVLGVDEMVT